MKTSKYLEELKTQSVADLSAQLVEAKKELFNLRFQSNNTVLTVGDCVSSGCLSCHGTTELLSMLYSLWH